MYQKSNDGTATLFLISLPIGNGKDITLRAIETLKQVDAIFCEDTRITSQILKEYSIVKKLIINHDHNELDNVDLALKYLDEGQNIGLVSDAGTPIISDPGYKIVNRVIERGYNVVAIPGATAFIPALITSSLEPKPFLFYGFLSNKESKRRKELESLKKLEYTIIFYEAPHRLIEMINDLGNIFGNRKISISREITKKYEEIFRGTIADYIEDNKTIKGEIVVVVEAFKESKGEHKDTLCEQVDYYISLGYKKMDAIKEVASDNKLTKSEVYNDYHGGKNETDCRVG